MLLPNALMQLVRGISVVELRLAGGRVAGMRVACSSTKRWTSARCTTPQASHDPRPNR
jgi:hypothetical protein